MDEAMEIPGFVRDFFLWKRVAGSSATNYDYGDEEQP
jgi:hypothetical protein